MNRFKIILWVWAGFVFCFYPNCGVCDTGHPEFLKYSDNCVSVSGSEISTARVCAHNNTQYPGFPEKALGDHGLRLISLLPDRPENSAVTRMLPKIPERQLRICAAGTGCLPILKYLFNDCGCGNDRRIFFGNFERCQGDRLI
jgi:hypothetical protein